MKSWYPILKHLSDGRFHSGEQLAQHVGVSRTAIWKHIKRIEAETGLNIDSVKGRGYRLQYGLELLDESIIKQQLSADADGFLAELVIEQVTESTNVLAASAPPLAIDRAKVWLAEHQTAGKGRRGRQWISSFGSNLYLSMAWRFDLPMAELAGISLVTGVCLSRVLSRLGLDGHGLKWPNDVLWQDRKLAGILVEAFGESDGPATAVIGIGVNCKLPLLAGEAIDQPWVDLESAGLNELSRNMLTGYLINELIDGCKLYAEQGLAGFVEEWSAYDLYNGKDVSIIAGTRRIDGVAQGIAADGGIKVLTEHGERTFHAGEVSLRKEISV